MFSVWVLRRPETTCPAEGHNSDHGHQYGTIVHSFICLNHGDGKEKTKRMPSYVMAGTAPTCREFIPIDVAARYAGHQQSHSSCARFETHPVIIKQLANCQDSRSQSIALVV